MRNLSKYVFLWLFIINLGTAFGAGLYESRVVIPRWADIPPRTWPNTGVLFWVYVTTIPLTTLTLANLVAAWRDRGPRRTWWLGSVAVIVIERIATFSYFIPTIIRLTSTPSLSEAVIDQTLSRWLLLDIGRHVLTLTGWLLALKTLSLPGKHRDATSTPGVGSQSSPARVGG